MELRLLCTFQRSQEDIQQIYGRPLRPKSKENGVRNAAIAAERPCERAADGGPRSRRWGSPSTPSFPFLLCTPWSLVLLLVISGVGESK